MEDEGSFGQGKGALGQGVGWARNDMEKHFLPSVLLLKHSKYKLSIENTPYNGISHPCYVPQTLEVPTSAPQLF